MPLAADPGGAGGFLHRHWPAVAVALAGLAAGLAQQRLHLLRLDPLGDDAEAEGVAEPDGGAHQLGGFRQFGDAGEMFLGRSAAVIADAKPEDIAAMWQRLGAPKEAKDYDFSGIKFAGADLEPAFADAMRAGLAAAFVPKQQSCFVCNKSFPAGPLFETHLNKCLESASSPPAPPVVFFTHVFTSVV
jgi:hypothetical protein